MDANPERKRILFEAARELSSPEERAFYLERACGNDPGLRRQIEAMLESIPAADEFFGNHDSAEPRQRGQAPGRDN